MMLIPNNEGKACDAVVWALERSTGQTRADVRVPDRDGIGPPIDLHLRLGEREYAIEHTLIELFEYQIKSLGDARKLAKHVGWRIPTPFLGAAWYVLGIPESVSLPKGKANREGAQDNLVEWVLSSREKLCNRASDTFLIPPPGCDPIFRRDRDPRIRSDVIRSCPPGFSCEFELSRFSSAALVGEKPGALKFHLIPADDLEVRRVDSLRRSFDRKCSKLKDCRIDGARTVLALESRHQETDSFPAFMGNLLPSVLDGRQDAPDEIFLVETGSDQWWVQLLKRDGGHWPKNGMMEVGEWYYDPGVKSGVEDYRKNLPPGMRDLVPTGKPLASEWRPISFRENELENLTER